VGSPNALVMAATVAVNEPFDEDVTGVGDG